MKLLAFGNFLLVAVVINNNCECVAKINRQTNMKRFLKPHWIFWLITLPQLLLITLYFFSYQIIGSLLDEENLQFWLVFGGILAGLCAFNTAYGLLQMKRGRLIDWWFGLLLMITYIPYLYFFSWCTDAIIPWSIPRWMLSSGDLVLYVFTFLVPALGYSILLVVLHITPDNKAVRPWTDFLMAILVPALWYFAGNIIMYLSRHGFSSQIFDHFLVVFSISGTVVFFIFLVRGIYIVFLKNSIVNPYIRLFIQVLIVVVFPVLGLVLNNGVVEGMRFPAYIFGDFSHPLFYVLAVVNGILLCIPKPQNLRNHLLLFTARSFTFSYIVYFFLVFLPYLPLAVPAIIVFGTGFLMLTPLLVFIIQAQILTNDYQFLQKRLHLKWLRMLFGLSVLSLPILLVTAYYEDRMNLHRALDHVYAPNFEEREAEIDTKSIAQTVAHIRGNKERNRRDIGSGARHQPYLTTFYQWLVLDNQTLSDKKLNLLEGVFTGEEVAIASSYGNYELEERNEGVAIDSLYTTSTYHEGEDYWTSWIHFNLHNYRERQDEFRTSFELPTGAWISDYYLVVEEEKKYGILAEKKAAMWVYEQITRTRRDPGILYYLKGNKVAFKVFPMNAGEARHTGIEIMHKEPLVLNLEDQDLTLGYSEMQDTLKSKVSLFEEKITYLPAAAKSDLPKLTSRPVYHFLLDCSTGKEEEVEAYNREVHEFLTHYDVSFSDVKLWATNYQTKAFDYEPQWEQKLQKVDFEGGFFAERAMQSILWKHHQNPSDTYPVFVTITRDLKKAIFTGKLADAQFMLPECPYFLHLYFLQNTKPEVSAHQLWGNPYKEVRGFHMSQIKPVQMLAYPNAENPLQYIADNEEASIVVNKEALDVLKEKKLDRRNWDNAFALHALQRDYFLDAEKNDEKWLSLIQQSFRTHIMSPFTSFIVVENEAQEAALMEKQRQVLNAKSTLDTIEEDIEMRAMSEPSWWFLLLFAGLLVGIRRFYH